MLKKILQLVVVLFIATQGVTAQTIQIEDVVTSPGDIDVQVDMLSFNDVAAITLYIGFDSDLLNFTGIDSTQLTGSWLANYNSNIDKVVVTYTATPAGTGYDINGKAFDLLFEYSGGFSSDVSFDSINCEIAASDLSQIPATYVNGSVSQVEAVGTVSMTDLVETVGTSISMPVNMEGAGFSSVGGITYTIAYDDSRLFFTGIDEDLLTSVNASASNGLLSITWSSTGTYMDFTSLSHVFDILFTYNGTEVDVEFQSGCQVSDDNLDLIAVQYTNGSVTPLPGTPSLLISTVSGVPDSSVSVPVLSSDFGSEEIGAITMNINYDDSKLIYNGYTAQQLTGWVVNNSTDGEVSFEWSSGTGETLTDGDLLTLNFNYDADGGFAAVDFAPGSIVKDVELVTIPVSFYDGGVDDNAPPAGDKTVSGQLTYNGDATRPIFNATVLLKNSADSSIAYTTTADADGMYSFVDVADGTYFLDALTTIDAKYSYDLTDAFLIYLTGDTFTGLQATASDVNLSGDVDLTDAFIVYFSWQDDNTKVISWTAPDWVFENTAITVDADVQQDFMGMCSGDADGSFVPAP